MATRRLTGLGVGAAVAQPVEFNRDIRPILSDRCFACHGPDAGNRKSPLRLDSEAEAKKDEQGMLEAGSPRVLRGLL